MSTYREPAEQPTGASPKFWGWPMPVLLAVLLTLTAFNLVSWITGWRPLQGAVAHRGCAEDLSRKPIKCWVNAFSHDAHMFVDGGASVYHFKVESLDEALANASKIGCKLFEETK